MTKKEKEIINKKIIELVKDISKEGGGVTAYEISKRTGIAYVTVQKYLRALKELKIVLSDETKETKGEGSKKSKNIRYYINYKYLHSKRI